MQTLELRKVDKNGGARYGVPGVRTSIYVPSSAFNGEPPSTLEVADGSFATESRKPSGGRTKGIPDPILTEARQKSKDLREQAKAALAQGRADAKAARQAKRSGAGATPLPLEQ